MSTASTPRPGATALTIFATPKKFEGHIGTIQRNAIASWTRMQPRPEIILFGTEPSTGETAAEFGLRHVASVKCNEWGTPLVSDLFAQAEAQGEGNVLCYVNADILLFDDCAQAIARVAEWGGSFLMVGRRTDLDVKDSISFQREGWAAGIRDRALSEGKLQIARSIDYFAFSRGLYPAMPPLAIGRFWWDNWLVWKARSLDAKVVDASKAVLVVHQNHDYSHTTYGPSKEEMMASEECIRNARLTCEQNPSDYDDGFFWRYAYTIDDATYKLTPAGVRKNPRHLWKQFKRYSSRPVGMAKLGLRALFPANQKSHAKNAVSGEHSQVKMRGVLDQLGLKKKAQTPLLPEALPYPAQVRRRIFRAERVRKRGGVEVFDTPEALALNDARMSHLESLGLNLSGKRVLDVGAGVGHLAVRLQGMGCSVVCLEGRSENLEAMRARYPGLEGHLANVENESLACFGRFDVVFSYGLLYHLENPQHAIRNLESACGELLLLETMVCDYDRPVVLVEDESADWNQALAGLGCRPSPYYVALTLNRAGFAHVYAPAQPPEHADFRFEWRNGLECVRDGHPLRCVFVASRNELTNPNLVPLLVD